MIEINSSEFNDKGYFIIKDLVKKDVLDKIIEELYCDKDNIGSHRLSDIWTKYDSIGKLAFDNSILKMLEKLYGRKPIPFQTLNFYKGTQQKLHSDQIHFCSDPENLMCGLWIALEDVTMENGPLIYYPGSHKWDFLTMQKMGLNKGEYGLYENKLADMIDKSGLKAEYGLIKKGDALLWHANLVHGGYKILDDSKTRMSMVFHYFFEKCQFWTPVHSSREDKIYRNRRNFISSRFLDIPNRDLWVEYYKRSNPDLSHFTDDQAIQHYYDHGYYEDRDFVKRDFDWVAYKNSNPELEIGNERDAITLFLKDECK